MTYAVYFQQGKLHHSALVQRSPWVLHCFASKIQICQPENRPQPGFPPLAPCTCFRWPRRWQSWLSGFPKVVPSFPIPLMMNVSPGLGFSFFFSLSLCPSFSCHCCQHYAPLLRKLKRLPVAVRTASPLPWVAFWALWPALGFLSSGHRVRGGVMLAHSARHTPNGPFPDSPPTAQRDWKFSKSS